jgi:capsular polysaccharide export protein
LNDPKFTLTSQESERAKSLISRICRSNFTKYNKYVASQSFEIEEGAVLVIDQKRGDASIQFAGARDDDFQRMISAAATENSTRPVYFKRHPDSILGNGKSFAVPNRPNVVVLPDHVSINSIIDKAGKIYTLSSQVGFEGLLRGKEVVTFGQPFYSGWGITDDRNPQQRRVTKRTIEEIFHVACIQLSVYANPWNGTIIEMEEMFDLVDDMRSRLLRPKEEKMAAE